MDNILLWVLLITFIAGFCGTGLGGVVSSFFKKDSKKTVSLLLSFAGGVMLAVVCFDLIFDVIFPENMSGPQNLSIVVSGIILGYAIVALLNYLIDLHTNIEISHIDESHPKTADDLDELIHSDHYYKHKEENKHLFVAGIIMATAIALHNLPEGIAIGVAYVQKDVENLWTGGAFILSVIIALHNIPEGMAVAVPLIAGGMSKKKAVLITALSGLPTVLGAFIGYMLGSMGTLWHALSLSFASGAMLYVVFGELVPESILMWKSKVPSFAIIIGMICGLIIIFI